MPGQASRRYSGDVTVLSIATNDIIALFKDVTFFQESTTQEARAAQDNWEYPVVRISRWGIDLTKVVEDEGIDWFMLLSGAAVAVIFESANVDGVHVEGTALLTRTELRVPDSDGQEESFTLVGQSNPVFTASVGP